MSSYVEFELEDGTTVLIEGDDSEGPIAKGGLVPASRDGEFGKTVVKAQKTFAEAVDHVRGAANQIVTKLRDLSDPPHEIEITFGLKASGELGNLVVGKGGLEANYTVKMKWDRSKEAKV